MDPQPHPADSRRSAPGLSSGDPGPGGRPNAEGTNPADEVVDLVVRLGDGFYGDAVDQRRHGLQCAGLARASEAADPLVAAALLHDIGHLLSGPDVPGTDRATVDDHHEVLGARWIAPRFGSVAARAVALHVVAKRYRCTVEPDYYRALSPTSRDTLRAQGGLLDAAGVARFEAHPGFAAAMALRTWDEQGKDADGPTPGMAEFVPLLRRLAARAVAAVDATD